ncbi:hypothetical protein ACHAXA_004570 [Cyclostephanos tholiformis]|uniref:Actin n=1 Tax=Cyclostephanos tholiformis TaxID=382380 RepID=A0ABD3RDF4_9STRA
MSTDSGPTSAIGGISTSASVSAAAGMFNQPIVIDCGSATMKAGFAGGTKPKVLIGTKVGRTKHQRVMPGGALEGEEHRVTTSSSSSGGGGGGKRRQASMRHTSTGGGVPESRRTSSGVNWTNIAARSCWNVPWFAGASRTGDGMPWSCSGRGGGGGLRLGARYGHIYSKSNLNAKFDEHPVLLTEPPHNPTSHRERLAEIFFETFRSPALFLAPPAVLGLYASGRTTGVVLDVGEGVTHCIPVYEGYALPHSIVRSDLAGIDVTDRLRLLLRRGGMAFSTTAESDFCSVMKEEVCYVTNVPSGHEGDFFIDERTTGAGDDPSKAKYQLPDGQVIDLSYERHRSSEVLFQPSLIGSEERPIHDVLLTSILQSDMDLRPTLFSNIILSGGSTLLPGLGDRLLYEVRLRAPERTKIRISAPPERRESSWVGGSILASLTTFKNMWVGRNEYEEYGSSVLYRGSL